jgi:hypothetical protein
MFPSYYNRCDTSQFEKFVCKRRMASSGMLRRVALVRTDVTANVFPSSSILITLMKEALSSFETSVLTTVTRPNILEDAILHSHRREYLKSYFVCKHPTFAVVHTSALVLQQPADCNRTQHVHPVTLLWSPF